MAAFDDDPLGGPSTDDERRAASALRAALEPTAGEPPGRSTQARWLAAHLRLPAAEEPLGEVRAWRLARAARSEVVSRKLRAAQRSSGWSRLGRALTSTIGLLAAATALLICSWVLLGRSASPGGVGGSSRYIDDDRDGLRQRWRGGDSLPATQALLFRRSFLQKESPAQRIELMIEARLAELRSEPPAPERLSGSRGLAPTAANSALAPTGGLP
jgi:hypothetical protein